MRQFLSLFVQDLLLSYRSGHVLITGILLVLMLLLVFFLPERIQTHTELVYDASPEQVMNTYFAGHGFPEKILFTDEAEFISALDKQPSKVGVIFSGTLGSPRITIVTQSAVPEENVHLLQASLDSVLAELRGEQAANLEVELLHEPSLPPPFNLNLIPIFLIFEVVLLGFFIAAVLVFQEKQEGTLRAYRITPAGSLAYILSKTALFIVLSLVYGGVLLVAAFGVGIDYLSILLLVVLSSSLMTMLSLAISVFFRNLSEWFFVGVAILMINSLPMISYSLPSFAPGWMTWLPSYLAVFTARDILFRGADFIQTAPSFGYLLAANAGVLLLAYWAVRTRLMKEGGR